MNIVGYHDDEIMCVCKVSKGGNFEKDIVLVRLHEDSCQAIDNEGVSW
jgi:hypothetical protein